jgi:hypothetical protein
VADGVAGGVLVDVGVGEAVGDGVADGDGVGVAAGGADIGLDVGVGEAAPPAGVDGVGVDVGRSGLLAGDVGEAGGRNKGGNAGLDGLCAGVGVAAKGVAVGVSSAGRASGVPVAPARAVPEGEGVPGSVALAWPAAVALPAPEVESGAREGGVTSSTTACGARFCTVEMTNWMLARDASPGLTPVATDVVPPIAPNRSTPAASLWVSGWRLRRPGRSQAHGHLWCLPSSTSANATRMRRDASAVGEAG